MCSHIPFIFIAMYYHILSLHILHICIYYIYHIYMCIYMIYITYISLYWSISVISSLWLFKQYYCDGSCSCLLALMSKTFSSVCITRNGMLCLRIQVSSALLSKPNSFPTWYLNQHSHQQSSQQSLPAFKNVAVNPTSGYTHQGNQIWKRHVHPNVHRSTVYHSQDMEAT